MQPFIPEVFGNRRSKIGRPPANQRGLVRSGGDHHGMGSRGRGQSLVHEGFYLASALSHQGDDGHVRTHVLGQHAQQGGLSNTATRKNPDSLTARQCQHGIQRPDSGLQDIAQGTAFQRIQRRGIQWPPNALARQRLPVQGRAYTVDDSSEQMTTRVDVRFLARRSHFAADLQVLKILVRHQQHPTLAQPDHLGGHRDSRGAPVNLADFSQMSIGSTRLDCQPDKPRNTTGAPYPVSRAQARQQTLRLAHASAHCAAFAARIVSNNSRSCTSRRPSSVPRSDSTRQPPTFTRGSATRVERRPPSAC